MSVVKLGPYPEGCCVQHVCLITCQGDEQELLAEFIKVNELIPQQCSLKPQGNCLFYIDVQKVEYT